MRSPALLVVAFLMPLPPVEAVTPPQVLVALPALFELVTPGVPETIAGTMTLRFADDASCPDAIPYGFRVANHAVGMTVRIETPNGTVPGDEVRGGGEAERALRVTMDAAEEVEAYARVDASIEVRFGACGTVAANRTTAQVGSRVAFVPRINLSVSAETERTWRIDAVNRANAPVQLAWVVRQPSLGRVIDAQTKALDGPGSVGTNRSVVIDVAQSTTFDPAHDVVFEASVRYDGGYPYGTDERPPVGTQTLVLHRGTHAGGSSSDALRYGLVGIAALLVIAGLVVGRRLRRRRGP